ncbi:MAG: YIP1 family protein [Cellvibrio sp.]|uniref:YIP1 family protein n=1 Tax=Cellvibrio sp. TaxID=1965322 RepID=UPI0031AE2600
MGQTSALNTLINILTSPSVAFRDLKTKPGFLFPLLALLAANIVLMLCFFSTVDFAWMIDQMVNNQASDSTAAERADMKNAMSGLTPMVMGASSMVGILFGVLVIFSLIAVYLLLVNKLLDSEQLGFKSWFSFTCWCAMPTLFTALASLVNVLVADNGQLTLEALNPVSINNLFLHLEHDNPLFGPISSWDPFTIWNQILMVLGFSYWMEKPIAKSAVIVLAPSVIIYGIWIAIALA